jgi:hypothetical protein
MIFETSIKTTIVDKNGNDKTLVSRYIFGNAELFGEVESKLYEEFGNETGFEVATIKISKLREIINEAPQGDTECKIYFATICDHIMTDEGDVKDMQYSVALHARDINEAHKAIDQYMRQGMEDMELVGLKCTKYISVL